MLQLILIKQIPSKKITFNLYVNTSPHCHEAQTQRCSKGLWSSAQQYKPHSSSPPIAGWHPPKFAEKQTWNKNINWNDFIPANPWSNNSFKILNTCPSRTGRSSTLTLLRPFARHLVKKRFIHCNKHRRFQGLLVPKSKVKFLEQFVLPFLWFTRCPSSHNHGTGKWVPPKLLSFHLGSFSTPIIMGERAGHQKVSLAERSVHYQHLPISSRCCTCPSNMRLET